MANPFKAFIRAVKGLGDPDASLRPSRPASRSLPAASPAKPTVFPPPHTRPSAALQQFVRSLDTDKELRLLDLGGANAANIHFMTQLGPRLYTEDFFATLEDCFGDGDYYENQRDSTRVDSFLIQTFSEQRGPFDGALVWDCLQFLRPSLLEKTIDHLHRILEPGAHLLAYFYADSRAQTIPQYHFRINDEGSLVISQRSELPPGQAFSNRNIERLFEDFSSTKFFLSRDNMREVLVRR